MTQTILLVEDDPDDAELFRLAAAEAGMPYPVTVARNGQEALDLLLRRRLAPETVLLDLKMPGLSGLEVLRRLRADPLLGRLDVIVLSSSDLESDKIETRRLGCSLHLTKPSSFAGYLELAARIKSLLLSRR